MTVGTIFEASHIPLHIWLQAIALLPSSKKGISSNQLHRTLGITLKAAWFMSHRIREAMRSGVLAPMGGIVEADETYLSKTPTEAESTQRKGRPFTKSGQRRPSKQARHRLACGAWRRSPSFHVENADKPTVAIIVRENVAKEANLHTDEVAHL